MAIDQSDARIDRMFLTGQFPQHLDGSGFIAGLAQHFPIDGDNRIGAEDPLSREFFSYIAGLAQRLGLDVFFRILFLR